MNAEILTVQNLTGGYPTFQIKNISFSLQKGDFVGVIGPNGSGKSTLMRLILSDLRPVVGKIVLAGKELKAMHSREKAQQIAVVTQQVEHCSMSVLDYVLLGRMPYRRPFQFFDSDADVRLAESYLECTGLTRYRDQPMLTLSGGEQQLAAIARALTQEPKLVLLDEPTSQLDICHQVQVLDLVRKLNREMDLTVLMIVHDLNLASTYCNRLLLLDQGTLFCQGTPDEVLNFQTIETVYKTVVVTAPNPITQRPTVFLVPRDQIPQINNNQNE